MAAKELFQTLVVCVEILLSTSTDKAFPEPVVLLPLNKHFGTRDISKNSLPTTAGDVSLTTGPDGQPDGAYYFPGKPSGYIEIPKQSKTDTRYNMSFFTWIYNQGTYGPILNYETDVKKWGLHVYILSPSIFYVSLVTRDNANVPVKIRDTIAKNAWTFVGFTYDYSAGKVRLYIDGILKKEADSPKDELKTNFKIRIGGTKYTHTADKAIPGRLSCLQIYNVALTNDQVKFIQRYCRDFLDIFKPCVNHTSIDVSDRQPSMREGARPSDKTTIDFTQWYRLTGKRILSSCPTSSSCGTQTPGWLNGQYPSREDGIKTMELCYRKNSDCCAFKVNVLVRQCYGHYVFKFHDFPVEGRFCTETDPETYADIMFMSTNERCLINHVFYNDEHVKDMSTCVSYCLNAGRRCKSVNYINKGSGMCQLNNATKSEARLQEDPKCIHYELIF